MSSMLTRRRIAMLAVSLLIALALIAGGYLAARRNAPPISFAEVQQRYGVGTRTIEVLGVRVSYQDEGSGPALVLLHGSFGNLRGFDELAQQMRTDYRIIRYDQPPSGLSGPVPKDFKHTSEAFLAAFLDRLGVGQATLLGTSSGGIIAYRFAATYPERTLALILSNVPPSAPVDNEGARRRLSPWLRWSIGTCMRLGRPWSKTCWRDFLESNFARRERVTEALVKKYYDLNRRPGAVELTSMTAIMRRDDEVLRFLAAVRAPTLLLWGRLDPVLPPPTLDLMAARLTATRARSVFLDDVSHYPPVEAPVEVAGATRSFLGSFPVQQQVEGSRP